MEKAYFKALLLKKVLILDGATGTELQKAGMPTGVCPELWSLENPEIIKRIQKAYIDAGSDIIYTPTFGGNRLKLEEFGLGGRVGEINRELARLSKEVAAPGQLVAGDLAPTGKFIRPLGDLDFDRVAAIYKEQVKGLLEGGVDLFVIETMMDLQEARAALIAVKESCDLPVCVSVTFDEKKRTISGTDPVAALIALQSLGADAVGCNCSTGPEGMLEILSMIKPYARVPLLLKPNAGLPKFVDGKTLFEMGAKEFGTYTEAFIEAGANLLGGCCGTSPAFIDTLHKNSTGLKPAGIEAPAIKAVTSNRKTVFFEEGLPPVIGESIRISENEEIHTELKEGKFNKLMKLASHQLKNGTDIVTIDLEDAQISKETMLDLVQAIGAAYPLCFEVSGHELLKDCLRVYPGRAGVKLKKDSKLESLLAVVAEYGAEIIS